MFVVEEFVELFGQSFFGGEKFVGCARAGAFQIKVRSRVCGGHNSVKAVENKLHGTGAQHA